MNRLAAEAAWLLLATVPMGLIAVALARLAEARLPVPLRAAAWRLAMMVTLSPLVMAPLAALLPRFRVATTVAPAAGLLRQAASLSVTLAAPAKASPVAAVLAGLVILWACGAVLALGALVGRWRRLSALVRESEAFAPGPPPARISDGARSPLLAGLLRPVILVPRFIVAGLSEGELAMILAHERAHLARRDNARALAYDLVAALLWFNPASRMIRARAAAVRELLCDAAVLAAAAPADRKAYAQTLVSALRLGAGPEPAPALINPEHGSLAMRLNAILKPSARPSRTKTLIAAALVGAVAALGAGASLAFGAALTAEAPPAAARSDHRSGATFAPAVNMWAESAAFVKDGCKSIWTGEAVLQAAPGLQMNADRIEVAMGMDASGKCGTAVSAVGTGRVTILDRSAGHNGVRTGSRAVLDLKTGEVSLEP